jgi:hypothetical protein
MFAANDGFESNLTDAALCTDVGFCLQRRYLDRSHMVLFTILDNDCLRASVGIGALAKGYVRAEILGLTVVKF